jgi:hypothetical protein
MNKKLAGILLIFVPFFSFLMLLVAYLVVAAIFSLMAPVPTAGAGISDSDLSLVLKSQFIIQTIFGLLAGLIVIVMLVGFPVGLILLITADYQNGKFSFSEAIKFGWQSMKNNFWFLALALVILGAAYYLPSFLNWLIQGQRPAAFWLVVIYTIMMALWILQIVFILSWLKISLNAAQSQALNFQDLLFGLKFKMFFWYVFGSLLYSLIVLGGLFLLVIPGIIWSIKFQFFPYFIVQGDGPIAALKKSAQITRGAKLDLLIFSLLLNLINLAGFLVLLVGLLATAPTISIALAYVFRRLEAAAKATGQGL